MYDLFYHDVECSAYSTLFVLIRPTLLRATDHPDTAVELSNSYCHLFNLFFLFTLCKENLLMQIFIYLYVKIYYLKVSAICFLSGCMYIHIFFYLFYIFDIFDMSYLPIRIIVFIHAICHLRSFQFNIRFSNFPRILDYFHFLS